MTLPREWTRGPQWASTADEQEWSPRLGAAQQAWQMLEVESVREGLRGSALVFLTVEELVRASADCARVGLELTPLSPTPNGVRAAVHRPGLAEAWRTAWSRGDDAGIGDLLGFPVCCQEFFLREWVGKGSADVVRAMRTVEGPWEGNVLMRWMGVRLVPFLPCSGDCQFALMQARAYYELGRQAGVDVAAVEAVLRLPVQYSALGGVAIVETPHFRFMAGTDYCAEVERRSRASQVVSPVVEAVGEFDDEPTSAQDNGFSTYGAMDRAHAVVAKVVGEASSVLDLGAGDGALLERLSRGRGKGPWTGVEVDSGRASRGNARHGAVLVETARIQDLDAWAGEWDTVLLMPGRLLEMASTQAAQVRDAVRARGKRLVVYAYGDVLTKHGGLVRLSEEAKVFVKGEVLKGDGVEAAAAFL